MLPPYSLVDMKIIGRLLTRQRPRPSSSRLFSSGDGKEWWNEPVSGGSIFDDVEPTTSSPVAEEVKPRRSSLFTAAPQRREPVVEGTPKLSINEALYLAKEAGIFTTREIQTHYIKSPSFSNNDRPFLLEDFFTSPDEADTEAYSAEMKSVQKLANTVKKDVDSVDQSTSAVISQTDVVPQSIHDALSSLSPSSVPSFGARGREWLVTASGKGTRKRSTAHVVIARGTGVVKVNGEEDIYKRWPIYSNRFDVLFPFEVCGAAGLFDVYIEVRGGGISGQAGAARLAVGRALVAANPACEDDLKESLVLFEDTRQKTSKFPGKRGAYARGNWTLR